MSPNEPHISDLDIVEEAGRESFPASDAPAWGTPEAMPSTENVLAEDAETQAMKTRRTKRIKQIAIAVGALAALVGLALTWRYYRAA